MARSFNVNGEVLVRVKGAANSALGTPSAIWRNLGLSVDAIQVTPNFRYSDIVIDAFGGNEGPPPDIQWMLADATIAMTLVHFDRDILDGCLRQSMGQEAADGPIGSMARAGTLMGGNVGIDTDNHLFIQLYLTSPIQGKPWYFPATHMTGPPLVYPLGSRRSEAQMNWRAIPYPRARVTTRGYTIAAQGDPGGLSADSNPTQLGAQDVVLWTHDTTPP